MNTLRTMMIALAMLLSIGTASAQDSIDDVNSRRNRLRLQGGLVPTEGAVMPLVNLNYHHRFFEAPAENPTFGLSTELGAYFVHPYVDLGVGIASESFEARLTGGAMLVLAYEGGLAPYVGVSAVYVPVRGDFLDVEIEARMSHFVGESTLGALTVGLALH